MTGLQGRRLHHVRLVSVVLPVAVLLTLWLHWGRVDESDGLTKFEHSSRQQTQELANSVATEIEARAIQHIRPNWVFESVFGLASVQRIGAMDKPLPRLSEQARVKSACKCPPEPDDTMCECL